MNHLTDNELIDYIIKFSDDPEKIRLATHMERVSGAIIDDLVDAGMDEVWCTFRSEYGGDYHPGQYIRFLEDEIGQRDFQIKQLHDELEEQKSRTIADLIQELNQQITTEKYMAEQARAAANTARAEADRAKEQLKMWNHLRTE